MRFERLLNCALLAVLGALAGCSAIPSATPVLGSGGAGSNISEMEFWHTVARQPVCTNDDALHGLLLYLEGEDACVDYPARVARLKSSGLLPPRFNAPAAGGATRGTVAFFAVKLLDLRGGLTAGILGHSERTAIRTMEYRDLLPPSGEGQVLTGAQFVGIVGRIEDYRAGDPSKLSAAEMPPFSPGGAGTLRAELPVPEREATYLSLQSGDAPTTSPRELAVQSKLPVTVTGVQGNAEVREEESGPWKPVELGNNHTPRAEFRTGPRGAVRLVISPAQTISVDRLSTLRLVQTDQAGPTQVTNLEMDYGRSRLDADPSQFNYVAAVRTPSTRIALRGTRVSLFDQAPYPPQAVSLVGRAEFQNVKRRIVPLGGRGRARVVGDANSAAEVALGEAVVDPIDDASRSASEQTLVNSLISRGAVTSFDRSTGLTVVRGGAVPTDAELPAIVPGSLNFVLRWFGDADLNLALINSVTSPAAPEGEVLLPAPGATRSPSGGRVAIDHRGGRAGGIEIISFGKNYQAGDYAMIAYRVSGRETVDVQFTALQDGAELDLQPPGADVVEPGNTVIRTVQVSRNTVDDATAGKKRKKRR